jgi:hypothetical protein
MKKTWQSIQMEFDAEVEKEDFPSEAIEKLRPYGEMAMGPERDFPLRLQGHVYWSLVEIVAIAVYMALKHERNAALETENAT